MLASGEYQGLRQGERLRKPACDMYLARLPPGEFQAGYQEVEGISLGYLQVDGRRMFALAQVLSDLFKDIPRTTISKRMESLRIRSRRCDLRELRTLKAMQSLPSRAVQGSLISREDLAVLCQEARRRRRVEPAPPLPVPGSKQGTSAGYSSDSDSSLEPSSSGSDTSGESSSGEDDGGGGSSDSDSGDSVPSTRYRQAALPEPDPSILRLSQHLWARSLQGQAWGVPGRARAQDEGGQAAAATQAKIRSSSGPPRPPQIDPRAASAGHRTTAHGHTKSALADPRSAHGHSKPALIDPRSAPGHSKSVPADPRSAPGHSKSAPADPRPASGHSKSALLDPRSASGHSKSAPADTRSPPGHSKSAAADPRSASGHSKSAVTDPRSASGHSKSSAADPRSAPGHLKTFMVDPRAGHGQPNSRHLKSISVEPRVASGHLKTVLGDPRAAFGHSRSASIDPGVVPVYLRPAAVDSGTESAHSQFKAPLNPRTPLFDHKSGTGHPRSAACQGVHWRLAYLSPKSLVEDLGSVRLHPRSAGGTLGVSVDTRTTILALESAAEYQRPMNGEHVYGSCRGSRGGHIGPSTGSQGSVQRDLELAVVCLGSVEGDLDLQVCRESVVGDLGSVAASQGSVQGHLGSEGRYQPSVPVNLGSVAECGNLGNTEPTSAARDLGWPPAHIVSTPRPAEGGKRSLEIDPRIAGGLEYEDQELANGLHEVVEAGHAWAMSRCGWAEGQLGSVGELVSADMDTAVGHYGLVGHRSPTGGDLASPGKGCAPTLKYLKAAITESAVRNLRSEHIDPASLHMRPTGIDVDSSSHTQGITGIDLEPPSHSQKPTSIDIVPSHPAQGPTAIDLGPSNLAMGPADIRLGPPSMAEGVTDIDLRPPHLTLGATVIDTRLINMGLGTPGIDLGTSKLPLEAIDMDLGPPRLALEPAGNGLGTSSLALEPAGIDLGSAGGIPESPSVDAGFTEGEGSAAVRGLQHNGLETPPWSPSSHQISPSLSPAGHREPSQAASTQDDELEPGEPTEEGPECSPARDSPEPRREHFDRLIRQSKLWCYAKGFSADGKEFRLAFGRAPSSKRSRGGSTPSKKAFKGSGSERNAKRRRLGKGAEPERQQSRRPGRKGKSGRAAPTPARRPFTLLEHFPCTPSLMLGADGDLSPAYTLGSGRARPASVPKPHPVWRWQLGGNAIPVPPSLKFRTYPRPDF
ncbi:elongin BC and Polycomb repressive complex 2-associated protein [Ambystoma mexicanum]|uniref:elongin BC and Polycomb repressive complex 2-associated protein n=1 Tax=Ambystoma mexicanum TaxID=8296 RepID=UPI0037E89066